jgi:serine protease Do
MKVSFKNKKNHIFDFFFLVLIFTFSCLEHVHAQADVPIFKGLPDFPHLVEKIGPSVVNIRTIDKPAVSSRGNSTDEEMLEFFRRFGVPMPNIPKSNPLPRRSTPPLEDGQPRGVGSGFILTDDGYVITNAHVVSGADEVIVTLTDKREFKAKLIGVDKRTDVAVVKIEANGLPAVRIGDVNEIKVGEWVIAIGSPFGLDNTVTAGIVSAKQRDTGEYLPFIQTDVAINPGNSGGPLINMRGEVIGINSQIYSRSGGFMGISFAIPIDEAIRVSDQLKAVGKVSRGRIGVQISNISKELADNLGLSKTEGAVVNGVEIGSPAEKAGIEAGDVIIKFDQNPVKKSSDLPRLIGNTKPGTKSVVTILRKNKQKDLKIQIAEMDAEKVAVHSAPDSGKPQKLAMDTVGLTVTNLQEKQKTDLKISGGVVVVESVGPAARAGLKEGDVIVSVAGIKINDIKDFDSKFIKNEDGKNINILFRSGDWTQYALIKF